MIYESTKSCFEGNLACINLCIELHGERIVLLVISACYNRAKVKHNNNFITENEVINTIAEMEKYCTQLKNAPWVFNNLILIEIEIKPCIRKLKVELNSNLLNKLK